MKSGNLWASFLLVTLCFCLVPQRSHGQDLPDPGNSVTVQLPVLGVSIDAEGVLTAKAFPDPNGRLLNANRLVQQRDLDPQIQKPSALRKVSLRRLEKTLQDRIAAGDPITEELQVLAGLQKIQYIFVMPDKNDIVIAGPAEGWVDDVAGRKVGLTSGMPTLLLEDLLVAIRTFGPRRNLNTWVAVSIDPTAKGIEDFKEFQRTIPARIPAGSENAVLQKVVEGTRDSLGLAEIKVYNVPRQSHLAQVLVEADYRMKLMAVGLEPKPIEMTTFLDALRGAPRNMQRWWLTPEYECLRNSADGSSVELIGRSVELKTENIDFGPNAQIRKTGIKPSRAARTYAASFTENYERLSRVRPVYAQLRNAIDVLVAAAWMKKNNAFQKSGWTPSTLLDNTQIDVENLPDAKTAPCVANAIWKGNVMIAPSGGGVSINAAKALLDENLIADTDGEVQKARDAITIPADRWWWD
jgi:hypothetical protein